MISSNYIFHFSTERFRQRFFISYYIIRIYNWSGLLLDETMRWPINTCLIAPTTISHRFFCAPRKSEEMIVACINSRQNLDTRRLRRFFPFRMADNTRTFLKTLDRSGCGRKEVYSMNGNYWTSGTITRWKGLKKMVFWQIRQSATYWKYRKRVHGHNQFNWIIWIADGEGEAFGFSFVKSNLSIVFAISKRKPSSHLEFESLFKKKKKKKKKSQTISFSVPKRTILKKKKKSLETIVQATIKITSTFAS